MNKLKTIGISVILLMAMVSVVSAETRTLNLVTKNPSTWDNTTVASAVLTYNTAGATFDYSVFGTVPLTSTQYALIYYADKPDRFINWGGNNPGSVIGVGTSDGSGNINFVGSTELNMNLPHPNDANFDTSETDYCIEDRYLHCSGAKMWLVPTIDLTDNTALPLDGWYPLNYLFETDLITYKDTDIIMSSASICEQPTMGISADPNTINFGYLYPGQSSNQQIVDVIITQIPEEACENVPLPSVLVTVTVGLGSWTSTDMTTTISTPISNPVVVDSLEEIRPVGFTAHAGSSIVPGTYTQTITISTTF